jgi:hypothetical protein
MSANDLPAPPAPRFWARQFSGTPTRHQITFDIMFGVMTPLVCLLVDPGIFRTGALGDGGMLGSLKWFALIAIPLQILTLIAWLWLGTAFEPWTAGIAGILLVGGMFAGLIGVVLLPLSLIGLLVLVGMVGFLPFVTAGVFLRNALRALQPARTAVAHGGVHGSLVIGVIIASAVPMLSQAMAQHQWPELETLPTYPDATSAHSTGYDLIDSGLAEEQRITFTTRASAAQIMQFYTQHFAQPGWRPGIVAGSASYQSFSGRSYAVRVGYTAGDGATNAVTIVIKRAR